VRPSVYNKYVHIITVFFESILFVFSLFASLNQIMSNESASTSILYIVILGILIGMLVYCAIEKKELMIVAMGSDMKAFTN
jgi:hypothetical protein